MFYCKLISGSAGCPVVYSDSSAIDNSYKAARTLRRLFLVVGLVSSWTLLSSCLTTTERQTTSLSAPWGNQSDAHNNWLNAADINYITPDIHAALKKYFESIWEQYVLMEKINGLPVILGQPADKPLERVRDMISTKYNTSFSFTNMPRDLEYYLRAEEFGNFYAYITKYLDRVVFYATRMSGSNYALVFLDNYWDDKLYKGDRIVFLNSYAYERYPENLTCMRYLVYLVHEAAHLELYSLVAENKLSKEYVRIEALYERYARLKELAAWQFVIRTLDTYSRHDRNYLNYLYKETLRRIESYNRQLGLPLNNREFFPI